MHPTISEALAKSRQQQFRREADQWRLARAGWMSPARLAVFGVALAALAGILVLGSRRREPMLALGLFDRAYSGGDCRARSAVTGLSVTAVSTP